MNIAEYEKEIETILADKGYPDTERLRYIVLKSPTFPKDNTFKAYELVEIIRISKEENEGSAMWCRLGEVLSDIKRLEPLDSGMYDDDTEAMIDLIYATTKEQGEEPTAPVMRGLYPMQLGEDGRKFDIDHEMTRQLMRKARLRIELVRNTIA